MSAGEGDIGERTPLLGNVAVISGDGHETIYRTDPITSSGTDQENKHCHGTPKTDGIDKVARRKLITASILCLVFMSGEIVGGALARSLAIMTDAAHLLTDFASFMISLFAIYIASRPATKRMSFGWHRAEVVGALVSVLMIWVVTGILVYLAVQRVIHMDFTIEGKVMLITSAVGVFVNIIMAATLHQHGHTHGGGGSHGHSHGGITSGTETGESAQSSAPSTPNHRHDVDEEASNQSHSGEREKENINVRAAFIHVIGDFVQSLGVFTAAIVIYFKPEYKLADPICTFIFSVLVLITTISILRDTMNVLMEGTPKGLDFNEVRDALYSIPGVVEVHNLRMWSLTISKTACSVHLAVEKFTFDEPNRNFNAQSILRQSSRLLRRQFGIHDVTVQLEEYVEEMADCDQCADPSD